MNTILDNVQSLTLSGKSTMDKIEKNNLLDSFDKKEPSENLKNFIVKYKLWWYYNHTTTPRVDPYKSISQNNDELLKNLSRAIMKEKKDSEYLFCSSLGMEDNVFFYGNKDQAKEKVSDYLLKPNKGSIAFFAVYDFVNDYESGIAYGLSLVDGNIEYDVSIE